MAGVRFRGDTPKLGRLARKFEEMSKRRFKAKLNRRMAETALELTRDGFERSITPYGVRWKNPRHRAGQPLLLTRRLESSIRPISSAERFELYTNVVYAATHQYGATIRPKEVGGALRFQIGGRWVYASKVVIPQRQFMPEGRRGFGGRWRRALEQTVQAEVDAVMGRG